MTKHGHVIKHFILDNECSQDLRQAIRKKNMDFQLVPPHVHRRNAAERAIRTFKAHFLSTLATCDPEYPIAEWDRLLVQSELTLNLLRPARCNPKLSAYAYLEGNLDYNKTPLAPPGTKVLIHVKPSQRKSWAYHGQVGWYVGPALHHYRCFRCFLPQSGREIVTDTVHFLPKKIVFPTETLSDRLMRAVHKIIHVMDSNRNALNPILPHKDAIMKAFVQVKKLLTPPIPIPPVGLKRFPPTITPSSAREPRVQEQIRKGIPKVPPISSSTFCFQRSTPIQPTSAQPPRVQGTQITVPTLPPMPRFPSSQSTQSPAIKNHHRFRQVLNHIFDPQGRKLSIDRLITNPDTAPVWSQALENELGRLSNGFQKRVKAQQALEFIHHSEIPSDRKVTYANFVCDFRPLKSEKYRVRMTIGGDKLDYPDATASPTASLIETKLLLNSVISDHKKYGSRFCSIDIKDFFLTTPMARPEYLRIHSKYFSTAFRTEYKLEPKIHSDGFVYCKVVKGMYGLKQAAILAYKLLLKRLENDGYVPIPLTNGLFKHKQRKTIFALCVDDFGVKYHSKEDLNHLPLTLKKHYDISIDRDGNNYCGLLIEWDYKNGYVDISMPQYVAKALSKYNHPTPLRPQYAPHCWTQPAYGQKVQLAPQSDTTALLDTKDKRRIQSVVGTFLFYGRAVEPTVLTALNDIATVQSQPTTDTFKKTQMLLDYLATYPRAKLRFYAGDMKLHIESDAAYLVLPGAKSRVAGYFYLRSPPHPSKLYPKSYNAPIHVECATLKNVVSSAAEAECGGLFHNCCTAIGIRTALIGMGHKQDKTEVITDNSTANSFVHSEMRVKRSKSWDMKYNWLRDRVAQNQFLVKWDKGIHNMADYFTKHHPPSHHKIKRYHYILKPF